MISVIIPTYNSDFLLKEVLTNIKDFADQVIITEGCWSELKHSTDNTYKIITEFQDEHPNCQILFYDFKDDIPLDAVHQQILATNQTYNPIVLKNELRCKQLALDLVDPKAKWWMLVDSDEIYIPEQLQNLKIFLEEIWDPNINYRLTMPAFVFYFNWFFGTKESFQRINSITQRHLEILYTDTHRVQNPLNLELDTDLVKMYHYSYSDPKKVKAKMNMWDNATAEEWYAKVYMPILINKLDASGIKPDNYHLFANKLGYGQPFYKFEGQHPQIIKDKFNV